MRYLTSVAIALTLAVVMAGAQSYPDTVDGHVAAAKAAAGSDYGGLATRLCTAPAPPAPRPRGCSRTETSRRAGARHLVRQAGQGLRQSLFCGADGIFGVGGDDVGRHHHHRSDLRLLGRGRSRERVEVAWLRSEQHQIRADQPRAFRSRRRRLVPAGSLQREGDHVGGRLDAARRHARIVAQAEEGARRHRRPEADAGRDVADAAHHARSHARHDLDPDSGARRRDEACGGVLGRHRVQLGGQPHRLHHARSARTVSGSTTTSSRRSVSGRSRRTPAPM